MKRLLLLISLLLLLLFLAACSGTVCVNDGYCDDYEQVLGCQDCITVLHSVITDTIQLEETKEYTLNGTEYEVTLIFISEPDQGLSKAKFMVNGVVSSSLTAEESETLGCVKLTVKDVNVEGNAEFELESVNHCNEEPTPEHESFLYLNEMKTFTIDGVDYEVAFTNVTNESQATFSVNGDYTDPLGEGESAAISDCMTIDVEELLHRQGDALVLFYIDVGDACGSYELQEYDKEEQSLIFTMLVTGQKVEVGLNNDNGKLLYHNTIYTLHLVPDISLIKDMPSDYAVEVDTDGDTQTDILITNDEQFTLGETLMFTYVDYDEADSTATFIERETGEKMEIALDKNGEGALHYKGEVYAVQAVELSPYKDMLMNIDTDGDGVLDLRVLPNGGFTLTKPPIIL